MVAPVKSLPSASFIMPVTCCAFAEKEYREANNSVINVLIKKDFVLIIYFVGKLTPQTTQRFKCYTKEAFVNTNGSNSSIRTYRSYLKLHYLLDLFVIIVLQVIMQGFYNCFYFLYLIVIEIGKRGAFMYFDTVRFYFITEVNKQLCFSFL